MDNTPSIKKKRKPKPGELVIETVIKAFSIFTIFVTGVIIYTLVSESLVFFAHVPIKDFALGTVWTPLFEPQRFGVIPLIVGTMSIAFYSMLVAIPLGLGSAIYLSEYAHKNVRAVIKPILEVLAGIPSIVYGYFALNYITPILQYLNPSTEIYNTLSASIAVGIMILPLVASLSEDAMNAVPNAMRNGAYALGATKLEVARNIVIPAAKSGIISSFVLAVSRAVGETMIVALAAGSNPRLTFNPFKSIQTMTGYMVATANGDIAVGSIGYQTIFAVGMVLFLLTFALNLFARQFISHKRRG